MQQLADSNASKEETFTKRIATLEKAISEEREAQEGLKIEVFKERNQARLLTEDREEALWRLQKALSEIQDMRDIISQHEATEGQLSERCCFLEQQLDEKNS